MPQSPLHDVHVRAGAELSDAAGWALPSRYGDVRAEYDAARASAAAADVSHIGKLVFSGPDRKEFLQGLLTNDVASLKPGGALPTCLLTHKGKLVADFSLYDRGEDLFVLAPPAAVEPMRQALAKYLPLSDTTLTDATLDLAALWVGGPKASAALERARGGAAVLAAPPFFDGGAIVLCAPGDAARLWEALGKAGAAAVGLRALKTLRVEAGRPLFGVDMGPDHHPAEAALEDRISTTKGCYLGQETVTRLKTQGRPPRKLSGLKVDGLTPERTEGKPLTQASQAAGTATSAVFSPRLNATLALALLKTDLSVPGARLDIEGSSAEVVPLPVG